MFRTFLHVRGPRSTVLVSRKQHPPRVVASMQTDCGITEGDHREHRSPRTEVPTFHNDPA